MNEDKMKATEELISLARMLAEASKDTDIDPAVVEMFAETVLAYFEAEAGL